MASWKAWEDRHGRFCHETTRFGPLSGGDGRHHLVHAENVERAPQIVDERCQAEFGAHFFQAAHQERALIHPWLDAAERMFDRLATAVENFRPRLQAGRHAVERVRRRPRRPRPPRSRSTQPPPSRLRPTSRFCRLYGLPCSGDFSPGRGGLLQLLSMSLSPCCRFHPAEVKEPHRSDFGSPCCLRPPVGGSAFGATHFRGHSCVHCCYGPVTRRLPTGDVVDRLQSLGFPPPCYPNYGVLIFVPAGLSPAEHASLRWTHNRTCGPRIRLFGSISQSSSTSWAETCGGLRPFHIALSEAIRASNHDGG